jgi:hypothetical protein
MLVRKIWKSSVFATLMDVTGAEVLSLITLVCCKGTLEVFPDWMGTSPKYNSCSQESDPPKKKSVPEPLLQLTRFMQTMKPAASVRIFRSMPELLQG